ncbi:ATP synthase F0 subunit A [Candidatus Uhrbacteria bacterium RIFCSPHIGHO2_01_FULL_63_20]|uniref:ATP synthase subunit a n=1 Tax=Candidatus Uhrbacteria bacterium RIFCSPHIGHO2_01_FULL_63_20 TaxID=1802385 RepID=A0A1F7TLG3_9BACT|nr:MAG: ATP synthase F0 subunit A [Candidatus Uhrbacteria bacterium RIFCSPHIGHO2_01_FULL_63_20]
MALVPAAAEPIFHLGSFPVTNALINGWIAAGFFILVAVLLRRRSSVVPKGLQNAAEGITEFGLAEVQKVTGDRERALAFFPIIATLFAFILFSNWIGLLPGSGSLGVWQAHEGENVLVPVMRAATSDLNFTLAIALFAVAMSHLFGLRAVGLRTHIGRFIQIEGVLKSFAKGPMAVMVALIEFAVGLLEIISEFAKVLSLSLRLFGNVFAGEVLLTVMLGIFAWGLPIPFLFLEVMVGAIQATVFSLLTLAYLTVMTTPPAHGEEVAAH